MTKQQKNEVWGIYICKCKDMENNRTKLGKGKGTYTFIRFFTKCKVI